MRINTELELAINLMARITQNPKTSLELAKELNTSTERVQKIAARLRDAELCQALRGYGGGYWRRGNVRASDIVRCVQKERKAEGKASEVQDALRFVLDNVWI